MKSTHRRGFLTALAALTALPLSRMVKAATKPDAVPVEPAAPRSPYPALTDAQTKQLAAHMDSLYFHSSGGAKAVTLRRDEQRTVNWYPETITVKRIMPETLHPAVLMHDGGGYTSTRLMSYAEFLEQMWPVGSLYHAYSGDSAVAALPGDWVVVRGNVDICVHSHAQTNIGHDHAHLMEAVDVPAHDHGASFYDHSPGFYAQEAARYLTPMVVYRRIK